MSPFLYTALPVHILDPDMCVQSMVSLKNVSVGLSCGFPLGAVRILHLKRETAHDRPTNKHFAKSIIKIYLVVSNLPFEFVTTQ